MVIKSEYLGTCSILLLRSKSGKRWALKRKGKGLECQALSATYVSFTLIYSYKFYFIASLLEKKKGAKPPELAKRGYVLTS
ncbi:hypothetical protein VN97_g13028 [Penicillium thymicola]|uniref:Uncharacterized protein n=1 Tax=Penicillium thymicola TaxID=293382 RepID=A0AAI9T513_PENTH|nr:hypothetical protein VN97_g13028 [Penicillium thymicola]